MSDNTIKLTGGRLGSMFETATNAFLNVIDPQKHADAYIGVHPGGFAETEFAGKYLSTCVHYVNYFSSLNETEMAQKALDHAKLVADSVIANQRPDGYIGGLAEGQEQHAFSVWNQAFTMLGLTAYYSLTGDENALRSAERIAEFNAELFMSGKADISESGNFGSQHLSILLPLVRLSKVSHNPTVPIFAHYVVSKIKASDNNFFSFDSIFDLRSKKGIENFVILLGMIEYGERFEDPAALLACEKYWNELEATQIRENGNGTLREFWTENGNTPRMLDLDVRPDENCVAVGWIEFSLALYYKSHDPKYIDAVERSLYNHLLGAISDDGTDFAYYQPNFGHRVTKTAESMYKCCRYRGYSAVSHLPDMLFLADGESILTLVYTDARFEDADISIDERSSYPYGNEVNFTLNFKRECHRRLILRVPAAAKGVTVKLDNEILDAVPECGLIPLSISADGIHELKLIFDIEPEKREVEIDGVKRIGVTKGCLLLAAETDGEPDSVVVDRNAPIVRKDGFNFDIGGVPYTDYATAGRQHNFIVWAREK